MITYYQTAVPSQQCNVQANKDIDRNPYSRILAFLGVHCGHLLVDHAADLANGRVESATHITRRECNLGYLSAVLESSQIETFKREVELPRLLAAVEGRFDPVLPLVVEEAVARLGSHLFPLLLAEFLLQELDKGFVDEDGAAEATWKKDRKGKVEPTLACTRRRFANTGLQRCQLAVPCPFTHSLTTIGAMLTTS